MGDIADMMIDGDLCEVCGVYLDDDEPLGGLGFPTKCRDCRKQEKQRKKNARRRNTEREK